MNAATSTPSPLRVGLIGAGGIAGAHIAGYVRNPDRAVVAAVADPAPEAAAKRADAAGAAHIYNDYLTMLEEADIDAVDICLPHHLHKDAIVAAARAGKHVLCEKPLCLTPAEAAEISGAVDAAGITVMCAHNQLFLPAVAKAKALIDNGLLGKVYEVRTTDSFFNDFTPESMGWRANAKTAGGGELIDTGYHPSYLLLHLAGGRPTEVVAMLSRHRLEFMEGEDSAQALIRFDNGVVGSIVTSWAYQASANTEKFSVVGERGSLYSDGTTLHYRLRGEEPVAIAFEPVHEFAAEIEHFATCIAEGRSPLHNHEDGIAVLGMILAAYESARTRAAASVLSADRLGDAASERRLAAV